VTAIIFRLCAACHLFPATGSLRFTAQANKSALNPNALHLPEPSPTIDPLVFPDFIPADGALTNKKRQRSQSRTRFDEGVPALTPGERYSALASRIT